MTSSLTKRLSAEFLGTFWLVFGGCGSAVMAAAFPHVGIGLSRGRPGVRPHRNDHGLRHRAHLRLPLESRRHRGIGRGPPFPLEQRRRLHCRAGAGGLAAAAVLYSIASGAPDFAIGGFAANGYGSTHPATTP